MTAGKAIALTIWTFVGKVMSLLFNMLPRLSWLFFSFFFFIYLFFKFYFIFKIYIIVLVLPNIKMNLPQV